MTIWSVLPTVPHLYSTSLKLLLPRQYLGKTRQAQPEGKITDNCRRIREEAQRRKEKQEDHREEARATEKGISPLLFGLLNAFLYFDID